jgi:hypothetical protein
MHGGDLHHPSVAMPIATGPDRSALINHQHPNIARITIAAVTSLLR